MSNKKMAEVEGDAALPALRRVREAERRRDAIHAAYMKTVEAQREAANLLHDAEGEVQAAWGALRESVRSSGVVG